MKPVNENATKEAKELLAYLYETAGKKIITGQHTQTNPMEEITYIHEKTGAYPKLQGFELLSYSPNINYADASEACLTEVKENQGTMDTAIKWAKETDGIVSICFHWFSPVGGGHEGAGSFLSGSGCDRRAACPLSAGKYSGTVASVP